MRQLLAVMLSLLLPAAIVNLYTAPPPVGPQPAVAAEPSPAPATAQAAPAPAKPRPLPKGEWLDPDHSAPNGTLYKTFPSKVLGRDVSYLLYLPQGYEQQAKRYPVIYWLHGWGGSPRGGAAVFIPHLDAAVKQGALPPAIVAASAWRSSGTTTCATTLDSLEISATASRATRSLGVTSD
jgi:hypothetical protein